jgi:CRISPR-associated protein Cmr5
MTTTTLDQRRAAHAWLCATRRRGLEDYRNLAKGAPALVMGSGLMAALAYWQSRRKEHADALVEDLLSWLAARHHLPGQFEPAMRKLAAEVSSADYMEITYEALALLRWLRQFADAVGVRP